MHRVDTPGAVAGLFQDGNPAVGQQATQLLSPWFNDIQENICEFIESTGLALEKGNSTQMTDAVQRILGNIRGATTIMVDRAIAADECGLLFEVPVAGLTVTLPAAAGLGGKVINIYNNSAGEITLAAGNFNSAYGTGTASITLPPETSGIFICDGTSWNAVGGAAGVGSAVKPRTSSGIGQWQAVMTATNLLYLPPGGTWAYFISNNGIGYVGIAAGSTAIFSGSLNNAFGFCWRIA